MTDSTDDYRFGQTYDLAPLIDDCTLLGSLLDDCLRQEVGEELYQKLERIRTLAECAAQLANKHDEVRSDGPEGCLRNNSLPDLLLTSLQHEVSCSVGLVRPHQCPHPAPHAPACTALTGPPSHTRPTGGLQDAVAAHGRGAYEHEPG